MASERRGAAPIGLAASRIRRRRVLLAACLCIAAGHGAAQSAPSRIALLIGVGAFSNRDVPVLEGPVSDVAALKDVLVRRWGFRAADIRTLVDAEGSRARILAELSALIERSASGDEVLIYLSGHGTSALDSSSGVTLPQGSGAFVPADFRPGVGVEQSGLIVGRTDLRPILTALEAGGRRIWVISDSCYSGQQVRSINVGDFRRLKIRSLPAPLAATARRSGSTAAVDDAAPEPYPYRATAYLSASSEGETAKDIPRDHLRSMPTLDGEPHGAFTDALLRVLDAQIPADFDGDGLLSLNEVHRAVNDFMDQRAYGQSPQRLPSVAEDASGLGDRAVLGARGVALRASAQPLPALQVRLEPSAAGWVPALAGIANVRQVGADDPADLILRLAGDRLQMLASSGDLLASMPAADAAHLRAQIRQFAWARHLRGLAERYRRSALAAELSPPRFGGNFVLGSKVTFLVRPERQSTLVLLNINADGKVTVLYPTRVSEDAPLAAGKAHRIPGDASGDQIDVREPVGTDQQLIFAFDERPPFLDRLHDAIEIDSDDPRLSTFEQMVVRQAGRFSFAATSLRTLRP